MFFNASIEKKVQIYLSFFISYFLKNKKNKKTFKMSFQRTILNGIYMYFQYSLYTLRLVVACNALQLMHLISLSIKVNSGEFSVQIYADVTKFSDLLK